MSEDAVKGPDFIAALEMALGRLKSRDRFSAELSAWLLGKGFAEPTVSAVIQRLAQRGMLSDERAAKALAARFSGRKSIGNARMAREMALRGAPEGLSATLENEAEAADLALSSKATWKSRAQAGRFLSGRGFGDETIENALNRRFGPEDDA